MINEGSTVHASVIRTPEVLRCPDCGEPIWDVPYGHKLAKCWGCGIAFDTMDGCAEWTEPAIEETLDES